MELDSLIGLGIPILTAVIAGFIAIYQMRINIRLNAKLKWKDEFRQRLNKFIIDAKDISHSIMILRIDDKNMDVAKKVFDKIREFDASFFALDLLLNEKDKRVDELISYRDKIREEALSFEKSKTVKKNEDYVRYFYYKAKDLYNDDKFISKSI